MAFVSASRRLASLASLLRPRLYATAQHPAASTPEGAVSTAPLKASTFTGKANFYETLYFLDDVLLQVSGVNVAAPIASDISSDAPIEFSWLNRERMQEKLGFELSLLEYRQVRQRLAKIAPAASLSHNVLEFLRVFGDAVRQSVHDPALDDGKFVKQTGGALGVIDQLGRAVAIGRRKSSSAKLTLLPGTGEFLVNGRPLVEYFVRPRDVYQIARPLQTADQFGKFNVWALVRGGGSTGIAVKCVAEWR